MLRDGTKPRKRTAARLGAGSGDNTPWVAIGGTAFVILIVFCVAVGLTAVAYVLAR